MRTTLITRLSRRNGYGILKKCNAGLEETRFDRLGCFTYLTRRKNSSAYNLVDDVPDALKQERADAIMEIQQGISFDKNQEKIGNTYKVLHRQERTGITSWAVRNMIHLRWITKFSDRCEQTLCYGW